MAMSSAADGSVSVGLPRVFPASTQQPAEWLVLFSLLMEKLKYTEVK